jgi:hypothetical protein
MIEKSWGRKGGDQEKEAAGETLAVKRSKRLTLVVSVPIWSNCST